MRNALLDQVATRITDARLIRQISKQAEIPEEKLPDQIESDALWDIVIDKAVQFGKLLSLIERIEVAIRGRQDVEELRAVLVRVGQPLKAAQSAAELTYDIGQISASVGTLLGQHDPRSAWALSVDLRRSVLNVYQGFDDVAGPTVATAGLLGERAIDSEEIIERCLEALAALDALGAAQSVPRSAARASADGRDRLQLHQTRMLALIDAKMSLIRALRALRDELRARIPLPDVKP